MDNSVGEIATWDFTRLSIELADLPGFDIQAFGGISGFEVDIAQTEVDVEINEKPSSKVKIVVGDYEYDWTSDAFEEWRRYVSDTHGSVADFIITALKVKRSDREEVDLESD